MDQFYDQIYAYWGALFQGNVSFADATVTGLNISSNISILTGTISNGGTIPLPVGFTQSQCKWIVGTGTVRSAHGEHDIVHNLTMIANSDRVVTATGIGPGSGTANYMIIGVK